MGRHSKVAVLVCALGVAGIGAAQGGQDDSSSSDVFARLRPEYDPNGIHAGAFTLYPTARSGAGSNSNVFNSSVGVEDYFYSLQSGLKLQSGWSRHELVLQAQSKSVWYSNQVTENHTDWDLDAGLRLDLVRGTTLSVDGVYALVHEARGMDHPGGAETGDAASPTEFTSNALNAEFEHTFNRMKLIFDGGWNHFDYLDTATIGSLLIINNDDRDRTVLHYAGKTSLEIWSDTAIFMRAAMASTDYTQATDDNGINRDSDELVLDGGLQFAISHVLVGEIAAGLSQKTFVDPSLSETSGANVDLKLKWYPSMLTNVTINGGRSNEETTVAGSSGFVATRGGVTVDHELLRNLILSGQVSYENDEYAQTLRNDDVLKGGLSGRYLINNNLHLDAGWEFVDRNSSDTPFAYSSSQFQLSLTGKM
ncbi:MAG: outer membrane beta-barrel protein [Micropepsaceae bacterium]